MATMGSGHELKFAAISASSSGANTLVAAVTGQIIKVISVTAVAAGAVTITFKSGSSPSLSGAIPLAENGGFSVTGGTDCVLFETASGAALTATLSDAVAVTGFLTYLTEVP